MAGTASTVRSFLLVEHPGPWGEEALRDARMPPGIGPELRERAAAARTKVLLIRRPARRCARMRRPGLRGLRPPRRALARDHRPRRPARRPRPRPRGAGRGPVARADPAHRAGARRVHPRPARHVLRRARPPGRGRAGRGVPRPDVGGEPHRRRPVRREPAGAAARPLLRPARAPTPPAGWPGCWPPASSTSTTCAAAPGWRTPLQAAEAALRRYVDERRLSAVRFVSREADAGRTDAVFDVAGRRYAVAVTSTRGSDLQQLTCSALRENPVMHHEVHEIRAL